MYAVSSPHSGDVWTFAALTTVYNFLTGMHSKDMDGYTVSCPNWSVIVRIKK